MSTIQRVERTCAVCGKVSNHMVFVSTNAMGSPDLDQRPPEMQRSTMPRWVQECPHCGYVSKSLEDRTRVDEAWLRSEEYVGCSGIEFPSNLARRFYRFYLINRFDGSHAPAFYAALYAAWECDDRGDRENAVRCRKLALKEMDVLWEQVKSDEALMVWRADLMRRAGLFEELLREYTPMTWQEELHGKIIAFQLRKARTGDDRCYRVRDVED